MFRLSNLQAMIWNHTCSQGIHAYFTWEGIHPHRKWKLHRGVGHHYTRPRSPLQQEKNLIRTKNTMQKEATAHEQTRPQ